MDPSTVYEADCCRKLDVFIPSQMFRGKEIVKSSRLLRNRFRSAIWLSSDRLCGCFRGTVLLTDYCRLQWRVSVSKRRWEKASPFVLPSPEYRWAIEVWETLHALFFCLVLAFSKGPCAYSRTSSPMSLKMTISHDFETDEQSRRVVRLSNKPLSALSLAVCVSFLIDFRPWSFIARKQPHTIEKYSKVRRFWGLRRSKLGTSSILERAWCRRR